LCFLVAFKQIHLHRKKPGSITLDTDFKNYLFRCKESLKHMQLMMYLGNDLIEAVQLTDDKISQPGYLGQFKRQLKSRYAELLQQASQPPEFYVINANARN
jgi:hypothetical protein